jgi:hypothetical protein
MIEVIHYTDKETEQPFEQIIEESYQEVHTYLSTIPENISIYFDEYGIVIPETGVGGICL